ncbi:hypothetical protein [Lysinibacillus xylanilyticus]|uniref:Uncharacterized protein n=2 Tax=Lysinibacillus xylanilyticus TaxID=582475 RepID=A0ABT4ETY6_9BACI|nr:hypothetical protein [Lysinibacillus xylanilyticus]MCY9548508.1 hypothetical protein [Lysinibacillus xylanilyticus]
MVLKFKIVIIRFEEREGTGMLDHFIYIFPALALVIGLLLFFVGRIKKNNKLIGVGIGFIVCLIIVESPDFIHGFIKGFGNGYNG